MNADPRASQPGHSTGPGAAVDSGWIIRPALLGPLAGLLALAALYALPLDGTVRTGLARTALVIGPAAGVAACLLAAFRGSRLARTSWIFFAAAAFAALVGQILVTVVDLGHEGPGPWIRGYVHRVGFHLFFAIGASLAIRPVLRKGIATEIFLDGGLILATALVVALHIIVPEVHPLVGASDLIQSFSILGSAMVLAGALAAAASIYFAGLFVLRNDHLLAERVALFLAGAAAIFVLGDAVTAVAVGRDIVAPSPGDRFDLVWLGAWALFVAAGLEAAFGPAPQSFEGTASRLRRRLRHMIVPSLAIGLGLVGADAALRPTASLGVAIACGLLGLLLALRISMALQAAGRRSEERRLLAQNRALVEVSHALACTTELGRTLELVTEWACRLLEAHGAGIELLDPDGEVLELRAVHGLPSHLLGVRLPVDGSFTGRVVLQGQPRASLDPGAEVYARRETVTSFGAFPTAAAPLRFREQRLGALFAVRLDRPFDAGDLDLLAALADQAALGIQNAQLFEQVRTLSMTDPLTGLANRRQLERDLAREFAAARRGRPLLAVIFDLDNFKTYNDRYGHLAGDEVLKIFGKILNIETRAMNQAVRYGGDEFVVLLSDTPRSGAEIFIERVAWRFQEELEAAGRDEITVSAGIAEFRQEMRRVEELIADADRSLYRVKAVRPEATGA